MEFCGSGGQAVARGSAVTAAYRPGRRRPLAGACSNGSDRRGPAPALGLNLEAEPLVEPHILAPGGSQVARQPLHVGARQPRRAMPTVSRFQRCSRECSRSALAPSRTSPETSGARPAASPASRAWTAACARRSGERAGRQPHAPRAADRPPPAHRRQLLGAQREDLRRRAGAFSRSGQQQPHLRAHPQPPLAQETPTNEPKYYWPRGTRASRLPSGSSNSDHQPKGCSTGGCGNFTPRALSS
jgi:hypothetical protein